MQKALLRMEQLIESLEAGRVRVGALARAEASAQASLEGTEKGVRAGTRTLVDVLNARQQVFETRQARVKAGAEFVFDLLSLKAVAGQLDAAAVSDANSRLVADARELVAPAR